MSENQVRTSEHEFVVSSAYESYNSQVDQFLSSGPAKTVRTRCMSVSSTPLAPKDPEHQRDSGYLVADPGLNGVYLIVSRQQPSLTFCLKHPLQSALFSYPCQIVLVLLIAYLMPLNLRPTDLLSSTPNNSQRSVRYQLPHLTRQTLQRVPRWSSAATTSSAKGWVVLTCSTFAATNKFYVDFEWIF